MKYKVIKSSEKTEQDFGYIKVKQLLNQENIENVSVAIIKIDGTNKKVINKRGDALYYVLDGKGEFEIDGDKVSVMTGDLVYIPKRTPYFDKGKLTMISFNNPRFNKDFIEYLT
jgi:mannose-6-phosphate isomerase-like protein (cupin superfamily)